MDICNKACLYKLKQMNISDSECLLSQCVKELIECRDGTACLPNFSYENICDKINVLSSD